MSFSRLDGSRISRAELWFLVAGLLLGSSVILPPGTAAGRDSWAATVLGALGGVGIAAVYIGLYMRFPGRTFVEISHAVYGRYAGRLVSLLFVAYLIHLASLILTNFGDFFSATVYRLTPEAALTTLLVLVTCYVVCSGIEVLARCSIPLVLLIIAAPVADALLMLNRIDVRRLLPVLETAPPVLAWVSLAAATFPFAETVAFLMVFPALDTTRRLRRTVFSAILTGGLLASATVARNTAVLGGIGRLYAYQNIQAVRMISIGDVLTRVEVFTSALLISTGFVKFAVLFYGAVLGLAQILGLKTYRPLVYPLGGLLLALSLINFHSVAENIRLATLSYPVYALGFQLFLPLLTLSIAVIRRLPAR